MVVKNCIEFNKYDPKIQQITRKIEANFIGEMMKPTFENIIEGNEGKVYQSMMVDEYAKFIGPKTGIAEKLACSMLKMKHD